MLNTIAKYVKILERRMCNKDGFISVLALGIVINVVILTIGVTTDTSKIRENNKAELDKMSYEQRVDMQKMADEVWVKYNNFETTTPYKFLKKGYTVKFPERDMYGRLIDNDEKNAKDNQELYSQESLAKYKKSLEME